MRRKLDADADYESVQDDQTKKARGLMRAAAKYIEDGAKLPVHPELAPLRMTLADALEQAVVHTVNAAVAASQIECRKRHGEHTHEERQARRFAAA